MNTPAITGHCHCGSLSWCVSAYPDRVTFCNCSICRRYQAAWGYYRRDTVTLADRDGTAMPYRWHDRVIDFVHCSRCGCLSHYADVDTAPEARIAVNFRLCDDRAWQAVPIRYFDGADTFREISNDEWLS